MTSQITPGRRISRRMRRPGTSGRAVQKIGQDGGPDRGEHALPGHVGRRGQAVGRGGGAIGQRRPERRRAQ
jgi:hypothetical protein